MIKCLIIDDEPPAREILESYVAQLPKLNLVASCTNALEALKWIDSETIDLIFLDINMPKISGINFYKSLNNKPQVIFTTAYAEYAVKGFELKAVDYLLKPFSFERFIEAVNRVKLQKATSLKSDFIMLKADKRNHKINFDRILYFESISDYVKVHLEDSNNLIISETLRRLDSILPDSFLRVHKSYIISIPHLEYVEGNQIKIAETKIPIGQSYRDKVNNLLKK
jgi:DNA-binding LytR/AlgR family response regulator